MKKDAITLTTLAARLERAIHKGVGLQGLKVLLYGWKMKNPTGQKVIYVKQI